MTTPRTLNKTLTVSQGKTRHFHHPFLSGGTTWHFILKGRADKKGTPWIVTLRLWADSCWAADSAEPEPWSRQRTTLHLAFHVLDPKGAHPITTAVLWPVCDEESERWPPTLPATPHTYVHPLSGFILIVSLWTLNAEILLAFGAWLKAEGEGDSLSQRLIICSNLRGK